MSGEDSRAGLSAPFEAFQREARILSPSRAAIAAANRRPEQDSAPQLIEEAEAAVRSHAAWIKAMAAVLVGDIRAHRHAHGLAADLFVEFGLSSHEGVGLMCLAEALLRIPDAPTRDALIRDKIAQGDWRGHLGRSRSLFVNAAAWALVTGKFVTGGGDHIYSAALTGVLKKGGEPIVRAGVDFVMRLLGDKFVLGQTIEAALARARSAQARGYRHSFDMLGEAAITRRDADRFRLAYAHAIDAVGLSASAAELRDRPGISIKLSALHPRYERSQRARILAELAPVLVNLVTRARERGIGVNIDAEEAERLDLALDCFELLCAHPSLAGWSGLGFVVQTYQQRAPAVIDGLIELAHANQRRLMVRLVKGAYWDSEIKLAQIEGLAFPVFTRKSHTDVCYLACAQRLLAAGEAVFPQFATHNAQTAASISAMARGGEGQWEFQCLYGMGEDLYDTAMRADRLGAPCRIYAPVGAHDALLPYLVRRLLENGASASFVRRLADPAIAIGELIEDPLETARRISPIGSPDARVRRARRLFGEERANSRGIDLQDETVISALAPRLAAASRDVFDAPAARPTGALVSVDPADAAVTLGVEIIASDEDVSRAVASAAAFAPRWAQTPARVRAEVLERAASAIEDSPDRLLALIVREAGRTLPNAVSELRETIDLLRYYAALAKSPSVETAAPLGVVACISPWNFPLSIFLGQAAAGLACGNCVVAKPAEQTPLTAKEAVAVLHDAGTPPEALIRLVGAGETGAALIADSRIDGVVFTGSTQTATAIAKTLSRRLGRGGAPAPFIAETGGQNAMIVDSSALPQQVVKDVLTSAFDSAGQRCSSLRLLYLQDEIADQLIGMIKEAMGDLVVGKPDRLATDVGPLIEEAAAEAVRAHLQRMCSLGRRVTQTVVPMECSGGFFVAPALVELESIRDLQSEIFGPVLHVLRFRREQIDDVLAQIKATGYGLTLGVHSRVDSFIDRILAARLAGNQYVNRNMIGAVVGVQPFGGHGLSGTGPKAGGPLYLRRLQRSAGRWSAPSTQGLPPAARLWRGWLEHSVGLAAAARFDALLLRSPFGATQEMAGPNGERNVWELAPRGSIFCDAPCTEALLDLASAAVATGNSPIFADSRRSVLRLPTDAPVGWVDLAAFGPRSLGPRDLGAALYQGDDEGLLSLAQALAERNGPLVPIHRIRVREEVPLEWLMREIVTSVNLAAAGGVVELMTL